MEGHGKYPFGLGFQRKIFALIVRDPMFLVHFRDAIDSAYFAHDLLVPLARIALNHYDEHGQVPTRDSMVVALESWARQHGLPNESIEGAIKEIDYAYTKADLTDEVYIRTQVIQFAKDCAEREAVARIAEELMLPPEERSHASDYLEWLQTASRVGDDVANIGTRMSEVGADLPEILRQTSYNPDGRVLTPFPTLNERSYGGFGKGELVVILGFSGGGKSMLAVNLAAFEARRNGVVFHYTIGDLNEHDVLLRYASKLSGVAMHEIVKGSALYEQRFKEMGLGSKQILVKEFPPGKTRFGQIRSHVTAAMARYNVSPSMVVVDYPDQLRGGTGEQMYSTMGEIYDSLMDLAKEVKAVVIAPSQISRKTLYGNPRKVQLSQFNVANSSQKTNKADIILTVNKEYIWVDKFRRAESQYRVYTRSDYKRASILEDATRKDEGEAE